MQLTKKALLYVLSMTVLCCSSSAQAGVESAFRNSVKEAGFGVSGNLLNGFAHDRVLDGNAAASRRDLIVLPTTGAVCSSSSLLSYGSNRNESAGGPSGEQQPKSLLTAGLLGGFLGFGSGQYYTGRNISGTVFLIFDALSSFILIRGQIVADDGDFVDIIDGMFATGFGVLALSISHVTQAIVGPVSANSYNKKLGTPGAYIVPAGDEVLVGLRWSF